MSATSESAPKPDPAGLLAEETTRREQAEAKVQALTAELSRLRVEVQSLLYAVGHDLQRPLRHARSFAEVLQRRCKSQLDAENAHYLDRIVSAGHEGQELLEAMLHLSRIVTRGAPPAPTDAEAAFDQARTRLDGPIREAGAEVSRTALPRVLADPAQLQELFERLLDNAVKFRLPGQAPRVRVSAQREGDQWVFSVADNGIGIDPKFHERIFILFQRLHTPSEYPGIGLGLTAAQRIVERHGGRIWVESQAGQGATFHFSLPGTPPA
jgi:light-regulated signal transduction histidine kinase (bacteriophytochrome)